MTPLKEVPRNDGTFKQHAAPLSRQNGQHRDRLEEAKKRIGRATDFERADKRSGGALRRAVRAVEAELDHVNDVWQQLAGEPLTDQQINELIQAADGFDGAKGSIMTSFAHALMQHGDDQLLEDFAELIGVDLDTVEQSVDDAIEQGCLPELDDGDAIDDDQDDDDGDDDQIEQEADEIQDRYGLPDGDIDQLLELAREHGLTVTDTLEQVAQQQGLDLDQLEADADDQYDDGHQDADDRWATNYTDTLGTGQGDSAANGGAGGE
jgi:hypothetical protein